MVELKKPCDGYVYIIKCKQCGGKWMQTEREHDHERILCPNCVTKSSVYVRLGRVYIPNYVASICDECRSRSHCENAKRSPASRNMIPTEGFCLDYADYPRSCADFLPDSMSLPSVVLFADEDDD